MILPAVESEPVVAAARKCRRVGVFVAAAFGMLPLSHSSADLTRTGSLSVARACPVEKIVEVCEPARGGSMSVDIDCDIDFRILDCGLAAGRSNELTKRLRLIGPAASGVSVDLNGAHVNAGPGSPNYQQGDIVEIRSAWHETKGWQRPQDVSLRNARVTGSVRVFGMGKNAEAPAVRASSRRSGHLQRVRAAAPYGVLLENLTITGTGRNLVYLAPGVTQATLRDSTLAGVSERVAIYLDAESGDNHIRRNHIGVVTPDASVLGFYDRGWPQLALDGSGGNRITENRFTMLAQGGIFLYRNCGEGGTIRHATASGNIIRDNVFEVGSFSNNDAAIHIGSRGYGWLENLAPGSHCDDDRGALEVGSALDNGDFSSGNLVSDNRFLLHELPGSDRRKSKLMRRLIKVRDKRLGNVISDNTLQALDTAR